MIKKIEITNFKGIGGTVNIPIRPITLIFGANSSGKSSIIQAFLLIVQSLNCYGLNTKGNFTDVGRYKNFIFAHDTEKEFSIKFLFDIDVDLLFDSLASSKENGDSTDEKNISDIATLFKKSLLGIDKGGIKMTFRCGKNGNPKTKKICLFIGDTDKPAISYLYDTSGNCAEYCGVQYIINTNHPYWLCFYQHLKEHLIRGVYDHFAYDHPFSDSGYNLSNIPEHSKQELTDNVNKFLYNFNSTGDIDNLIKAGIVWSSANDILRREFEALLNLDNNIEKTLRLYIVGSSMHTTLEFEDQFFPDEFSDFRIRDWLHINYSKRIPLIYPHPGFLFLIFREIFNKASQYLQYIPPLREPPKRYYLIDPGSQNGIEKIFHSDSDVYINWINEELKNIGSRYTIEIVKLQYDRDDVDEIFQLRLFDEKTKTRVSIKDVGFGFSQILPIIIPIVIYHHGLYIIEQPELHLHPAMQAEIADTFIRSLSKRNSNFILETHSEHLILRLLRRVRQTTTGELPDNVPPIKPDDIAVLYVQSGDKGAEVAHIPITEDGDFSCPWPKGFFPERIKELL